MQSIKNQISILNNQYFPENVAVRRHLHQNPELSFEEYETSKFICRKLDELGIDYQDGIAKTGITAWIRGRQPNSGMVALRADMDALPIEEQNEVPYRSMNQGVMHACGHDLHVASLLGTARILQQLRNNFEGTVMLIFQPAEETLPGGARSMIDAGIFDKRKPDLILAQHVMPSMDTGMAGFRPAQYMASCDEFYITVKGKGGHGAMPHQVVDPIVASSHLILALQQIVSRNAEATVPTVLSIGKVIANGATNIIPGEVLIGGTFRTVNEAWRTRAHEKIAEMSRFIAESMGCTSEISILKGEPVLINDKMVTAQAKIFASEFLGPQQIIKLDPLMTSDDFAHFTQDYPCSYYRLGVRTPGTKSEPQHSSRFNVDEEALKTGPALMAWLTMRFLNSKTDKKQILTGIDSSGHFEYVFD
jgi:amidohydrolase